MYALCYLMHPLGEQMVNGVVRTTRNLRALCNVCAIRERVIYVCRILRVSQTDVRGTLYS